jgi:uncharacterized protein YjbI with pentapeptide repeats
MRRWRAILFVVWTTMAWFATLQAAAACSCRMLQPEEYLKNTPFIFAGRVVDVRQSRPPGSPEIVRDMRFIAATIEVSERWKGDVPPTVIVHGNTESSACGYSYFPVGQRLVIFGFPASGNDGLTTSFCSMPLVHYATNPERNQAIEAALDSFRVKTRHFDAAIAAAPKSTEPLLRKARFLDQWQDFSMAANTYAEAARIAPSLVDAHFGDGHALFELRRYAEAKVTFQRVIALQPSNTEAARLLFQTRLHLGDQQAFNETNDLRGLNQENLNLSGFDLRGRDFSNAYLDAVNLDGADLRDSIITSALIRGSMKQVDLRGARFTLAGDTNLSGARLDGANLQGALFARCNFDNASLRSVVAARAQFLGGRAVGASFMSANLDGARFEGTLLTGADFSGASLASADLSSADISQAMFQRSSFDCHTKFPKGFRPDQAGMIVPKGYQPDKIGTIPWDQSCDTP